MIVPDNIDEVDAKGGGNEVLPAGQYIAEVAAAEEKVTSNGKSYMNLRFRVIDGDCEGRQFFEKLFTSGNAVPRFKLACIALGVALKGGMELHAGVFVGRKAVVTLKVETYLGKDQNKISYDGWAPYDDSPLPEGAEEELAF